MDDVSLGLCGDIIPSSYVSQGNQSLITQSNLLKVLLEKKKIPKIGWSVQTIEYVLSQFSLMDSNNFVGNCGVGEREGRIFSETVARRHYRFAHGIGRSGDVTAIQPKAAGSSLLNQLCSCLLLHLIQASGIRSATSCIIVPMATGMALALCFLTLRHLRPMAEYIIWPRIDQKSCFKAMLTAGFKPVVIENLLEGDELRTNVRAVEEAIQEHGADKILCIYSTTSCFAPRVPDRVEELAIICKEKNIPHVINNAYGLQASKSTHLIEQAIRVGRVDVFVQSCDKNLMVPVGGSVIASANKSITDSIARMYAGRASAGPSMDVFITLLEMGILGYERLLKERKERYELLKAEMTKIALKYDQKILDIRHNPISIAMTLPKHIGDAGGKGTTELGSMLFTRCISGSRVVAQGSTKEIEGYSFNGYGSHCDNYPYSYLTAAAAIGISLSDVESFCKRLDKVLNSMLSRQSKSNYS